MKHEIKLLNKPTCATLLPTLLLFSSATNAAVPKFEGGWVHDGIYAARPLEGAEPTTYKEIISHESMSEIAWAIENGMRQITLNVGVDHLVKDWIDADNRYVAEYRADSLNRMLKKVVEWNASHASRPDMQVGVKVRLHAGTRQTRTVKDALGTIKVTDEGFGVVGTVPIHWDVGREQSFQRMYERQMSAIAKGISQFNKANGNAIQSVIVPGNAFFYPEPFTMMQGSRLSTPGLGAKGEPLSLRAPTSTNALLRSKLSDGSDAIATRSYIVRNLGGTPIIVRCGGDTKTISSGEYLCASNPSTTGKYDLIYAPTYPAKFQLQGATNKQKLEGYGLTGNKQVEYFKWLSGRAHNAFTRLNNVRVGIALNPYQSIDSTDARAAKCLAIETGNAWVAAWKDRAQIENYSYRTLYAKNSAFRNPRGGHSKHYEDIYAAMDQWANKKGVLVGVQLARTPRVWRDWNTEKVVWNQLLMDAVQRGWSFVEPAGRPMDGHAMNAWPAAYSSKRSTFRDGAIGLEDNHATSARTDYDNPVHCN